MKTVYTFHCIFRTDIYKEFLQICSCFLGRALQQKKHHAFHFFSIPVMQIKPNNACALVYSIFEIFPLKPGLIETEIKTHNHNVNVYFQSSHLLLLIINSATILKHLLCIKNCASPRLPLQTDMVPVPGVGDKEEQISHISIVLYNGDVAT